MQEIIVRFITLPTHVRAFTIPDAQGDYNVYINDRMTREQQRTSFAHEKKHIDNGDFNSRYTALEIERKLK